MTETVAVRWLRQSLPHVVGDVSPVPVARLAALERTGFAERYVPPSAETTDPDPAPRRRPQERSTS